MRSSVRHASCVVGVIFAATAMLCAPVALAVFSKSVVGGPLMLATSTLSPASGVSATQYNCRTNKPIEISVAWSATNSSYATSYTVERATASAGPYTSVSSVEIGKRTYIDNGGSLAYSTTYYYRVSAVYHLWSAASTATAVKTLSKSCSSS